MVKYYGIELSPNKTETVEGFLICRNVPIARTGAQQYLAVEIGADLPAGTIVNVVRPEEEVFSAEALASFEGKPVTNEHPKNMVDPDNFTEVSRGHAQNVRRVGDNVVADLYISDAQLIEDVQNKVKKEVSCGYTCEYVQDGDTWKQTKIRGNHVAIVPIGRAGHDVSIKDSAITAANERSTDEVKKGNIFKDLFSAFGKAAKDAEPEEVEKMVEAAAEKAAEIVEAQEEAPAEKAPETEPAKDEPGTEEEKKPAADEGEDLAALIKALTEKVNALITAIQAKDEEPEKTPEQKLDEAIAEAEKDEGETEEKTEEKPAADPEAAVTVKAEELTGDECGETDTAKFLKAVKPIIAGIKNPEDKKRAVDAALSSIKGKTNYDAMFSAAKDSAAKAANNSGKTSYAKRCEDQQSAYDGFNPHKH